MKARVSHESARTGWLVPLALFVITLCVYVPTVATGKVNTDSQAAAAGAWRIASTGQPWMDEVEIGHLEGTSLPLTWVIENADGKEVYNRTGGVILAGVPFYWAFNRSLDPRDFEIAVGGVAAATFTAAAGMLLFVSVRSYFHSRMALGVTATFLFATPVWSVSADALWTHSLTIFGILGAVWAATRSHWSMVGIFLAMGIFARPHLVVVAAVLGLYLGWRRRNARIVGRIGASSAVGLCALVAWNRIVFGEWSVSGGYGEYVANNLVDPSGGQLLWNVLNLVGFLFSFDRGLLIWTPIIVILLPALLARWREMPDWVKAFVFAGLGYSIVQLRINSFQGGQGYYGYRLALELLACLTPALVYAFRFTARWTRVALGALVGLQFAAIAFGAISEAELVKGKEAWTMNSFAVALSQGPVALAALTVAAVVVGGCFAWFTTREPRALDTSGIRTAGMLGKSARRN